MEFDQFLDNLISVIEIDICAYFANEHVSHQWVNHADCSHQRAVRQSGHD